MDFEKSYEKIARILGWLLLVMVICFLLLGCSRGTPKLNRSFLPEAFNVAAILNENYIQVNDNILSIPINKNRTLNQKIISYWKQGDFDHLFAKSHPVIKVNKKDIILLESFLNHGLRMYYVLIENNNSLQVKNLFRLVQDNIQCMPLSNSEIRFLMNSETATAFSLKPLTMLMISASELLLQLGATPEYPKIFSPYLRGKYHLPQLKHPKDSNLFPARVGNALFADGKSGFVVCRL